MTRIGRNVPKPHLRKGLSFDRQGRYSAIMASIWKLAMLAALLFLPFGMNTAQANAPQQTPMADMPIGHCPDQNSPHDMKGRVAECTMGCSAALPARDAQQDGPMLIICTPIEAKTVRHLQGLHPETATPPPRHG